jgi:hypothetical protein
MSKTTDTFFDWLMKKKIREYRLEMLTDFVDTPQLLMGDGLRSFEILSLFVPTLTIGPLGYPVPGGAFSNVDNDLKYPATTKESRDILQGSDYRNTRDVDADVQGGEHVPIADAMRWHYEEKSVTAVGGVAAVVNMMSGDDNYKPEAWIYYANLLPPDNVAINHSKVVVTVSAGARAGGDEDIYFHIRNDATNGNYAGVNHLTFPGGKRFKGLTAGTALQVGLQNGLDDEVLCVGYAWRYVS